MFALATVASPAATIADQTFVFSGVCSDCDGLGKATLVVTNYTLGDPLTNANLVSFTYEGSNLLAPFTILPEDLGQMQGTFPSSLPAAVNFSIFTFTLNPTLALSNGLFVSPLLEGGYFFETQADGFWQTGQGSVNDDFGTGGNWSVQSAVPEPSSALLLISAGLVLVGARKLKR